jgi:hypothetical protein
MRTGEGDKHGGSVVSHYILVLFYLAYAPSGYRYRCMIDKVMVTVEDTTILPPFWSLTRTVSSSSRHCF